LKVINSKRTTRRRKEEREGKRKEFLEGTNLSTELFPRTTLPGTRFFKENIVYFPLKRVIAKGMIPTDASSVEPSKTFGDSLVECMRDSLPVAEGDRGQIQGS
jgi:hypothetical protein